MRLIAGLGIIALLIILISCQKQDETNISTYNSRSHNMGKDCMDCHVKGGPGKGWFIVAGTVYDTIFPNNGLNPHATVYLYNQFGGQGALVATLEGDTKGNFYTTSSVNFGNGLYPEVISAKGNMAFMSAAITQGACNSCHNYNTYKIYIK